MWLPEGEHVPDHATFARFQKRCAKEIEDLFYQYARLMEGQGETDPETVFIDGTKLESAAGEFNDSAGYRFLCVHTTFPFVIYRMHKS